MMEERLIAQRYRAVPEHVMTTSAEGAQPVDEVVRPCGSVGRRPGQNADQAIFRDRARGPAGRADVGKPLVSDFMMDVIRVEERDKDVDVKKRHALLHG